MPASVGSQKVSPSTQSSHGKNADRSTLPKSVQEGNDSKCNAPSGKNGAAEANTDSPMKGMVDVEPFKFLSRILFKV